MVYAYQNKCFINIYKKRSKNFLIPHSGKVIFIIYLCKPVVIANEEKNKQYEQNSYYASISIKS